MNRQLLVANAFEQWLEEAAPRAHRRLRTTYDRFGLPVSRWIRNKWLADLVYLLMKPAEWLFCVWLYRVDPRPEERIQAQYLPPHNADRPLSGVMRSSDTAHSPTRGNADDKEDKKIRRWGRMV